MHPIAPVDDDRPSVASVTKYIPYAGIAHAGGEYAFQHFRALRACFALTAVAPASRLNREAVTKGAEGPLLLLSGHGPTSKDRLKLLADIGSLLRGSAAHAWFARALRRSRAAHDLLTSADIVEFQWSEMGSLAPIVRAAAPRARLVVVAHDVITQRWSRAARTAPHPLARLAYRVAARLSARRERRTFTSVDRVIVFSEKDATLVRDLAPAARAVVIRPGFPIPDAPTARRQSSSSVVFSGAMNRPDNDEAARWFLREVWPAVRSAVPSARFTIVGAHPSAALRRLAEESDGVTVTGFVETMEPYLDAADVVVVPLHNGAGVKFKTIDALLRGIPVVSTTVGAEGIERDDAIRCITDDPQQFARGIIESLGDPDRSREVRIRQWARDVYGLEAFRSRLTTLYQELIEEEPR
ncbi:glycosyltransferase [Microbacterium sp. EF45047]|uniref:glycosyltransferase n=1 Tax=Microbacterium sp. EF45047 TaxID=2809708 RepID=UPI00234AFCC6|nr:glycosyltransferase [Microbacterium sp. EF45047]WCM56349.1 glycosyltransferase [Microbacterium sp. EF45047]